MPNGEWYTIQEIADDLGITITKLYPVINNLKIAGVIRTTPNPLDRRLLLIHVSSLPIIRRAFTIPNDGSQTA